MAASGPTAFPGKMSHKKYKAALKKERRRKRRQELARLRDAELAQQEEEEDAFAEEKRLEEERLMEEERQKLHEEWLLREEKAQEEFRAKKKKEEAARKRKEEQERKLKAEWEEQQRKEREEEEQKQQEKRERELENGGTWQNPEPPTDVRVLEKDRANCPFYSKTGACRFGDRCSRKHNFPTSSPTLLIKSMFTTFGMEQCRRDDYDPDSSLEYSEEETYQQFLDFYHDVLPEFKNVGKVVQFKVSCNLEPHLRGNVYVQYQSNPNNEFREANRDIYQSPDWTSSSFGKNFERRERTSHYDDIYYGRSRRRRSLSPDLSYKRNEYLMNFSET
ncbi:hypothetical protein NN561_012249 [Cricetulus griseus]